MAKKQIKTSRYWTRECPNCGYKYPNWFTNCPKCHSTWNGKSYSETSNILNITQDTSLNGENQANLQAGAQVDKQVAKKQPHFKPIKLKKKTVRIIAQISGEDSGIQELLLNFTADGGESWYQMPMIPSEDFYYAEIEDVPLNTTIIYYLKGKDSEGIEFIENNDGEYYYYEVYDDIEDSTTRYSSQPTDFEQQGEGKDQFDKIAQDEFKSEEESNTIPETNEVWSPGPSQSPAQQVQLKTDSAQNIQESQENPKKSDTAESSPFTGATFIPIDKIKKDQNLKECPNCHAKIKKDWSACPICGFLFT